jgi:hypothetical protein
MVLLWRGEDRVRAVDRLAVLTAVFVEFGEAVCLCVVVAVYVLGGVVGGVGELVWGETDDGAVEFVEREYVEVGIAAQDGEGVWDAVGAAEEGAGVGG